jgi:hypothetical protein
LLDLWEAPTEVDVDADAHVSQPPHRVSENSRWHVGSSSANGETTDRAVHGCAWLGYTSTKDVAVLDRAPYGSPASFSNVR